MKQLLLVLAFCASLVSGAFAQGGMIPGPGTPHTAGAAFVGVGDILTYVDYYSCTRSLSAAYATGSNPACKIEAAAGGTQFTINILSNGNFDTATANSDAGVHTTCTSMAMSGTSTATFVGCGATPTQWDYVTGTTSSGAIIKPLGILSCGTFSGGGGTCTMVQPLGGTYSTVSLTSVSVQNGMGVTEFFDQTGNANHQNITSFPANAAPWFPDCGLGFPCAWGIGNAQQYLTAGSVSVSNPASYTVVGGRAGGFTSLQIVNFNNGTSSSVQVGFENIANNGRLFAGSTNDFTMADSVLHTLQAVTGTSGFVYVDATLTSTNSGTTAGTVVQNFMNADAGGYNFGVVGPVYEAGVSNTTMTSGGGGTALLTHANQCAYYGTTC